MTLRDKRKHALKRHVDRLDRKITVLAEHSDRLARQRLGAFLFGIFTPLLVGGYGTGAMLAVALGWMVLFVFLVIQHAKVRNTLDSARARQRLKADLYARLTLDWDQLPRPAGKAPAQHPFALDIDITGDYSLHRLLDTCVTYGGSQRLLGWLLSELIPLKGFREALTVAGQPKSERIKTTARWDGQPLVDWLKASAEQPVVSGITVMLLAAIALTTIILFALNSNGSIPPLWIGSFILYAALSVRLWSQFSGLFQQALTLQTSLTQIRSVFQLLERYPHGNRLSELCKPFTTPSQQPSAQLRRVAWIVSATSIQQNPVVWMLLNLFMPYDVFFAYLLGRTRRDLSERLPQWLDVWYEIESLNALATFAYLNPDYTFPHLSNTPEFRGGAVGHPLIPHEEKVHNDFMLNGLGQVVIITGSNMSGKSSFLRTLGLNMVLTYAGGVVDAQNLHVGLFRLFTCIRVADSVVDGISYFYAEVKRLRALLDALHTDHEYPLFFLIDEIFRGTNNRERLIGSESFIRALVGEPSMGLISTHDLELVKLADDISQISNYHFREHIHDDRMAFDYQLREGPSPTTNALKIMMIEGLPVRENPA
jgi:hypothetical protein